MHVDLTERVPGVDPERALDWWMDFRDGHDDHAFVPGARRRVLERTPDSALLEERVRPLGLPLFQERVSIRREGSAAKFSGVNTYASFQGEYAFEPGPDGTTTARLRADVKLKRPWVAPRALVERVLRQDLKGHLRRMAADLRADPGA